MNIEPLHLSVNVIFKCCLHSEKNLFIATICCDLSIAILDKKMHNKLLRLSTGGYMLSIVRNLPVDNQNYLHTQFLVVSHNGLVSADGCDGQVFY